MSDSGGERESLLSRAVSDAEKGELLKTHLRIKTSLSTSAAAPLTRSQSESSMSEMHDIEASDSMEEASLSEGLDEGRRLRSTSKRWSVPLVFALGVGVAVVAAACVVYNRTTTTTTRFGGDDSTTVNDSVTTSDSSAAEVDLNTVSDPRLAGYSKKEVADAVTQAMEYVRQEENDDSRGELGALDASDFPSDTWDTPMHLMAVPGDVRGRESLKVTLSKLLTSHTVQTVSKNVRITPGLNPTAWPQGLDRTVYALKSVFANLGGDYLRPDFTLLRGLDWLEAPNSRDLDGKIAGAWAPLAHHVGLLFGHFYQWQLAKDAGYDATIIVDTDGLDPVKLAVPMTSFGAVVDHAPDDFDIILLNAYSNSTGTQVIERFPDTKGNTVQLTTWDQPGRTGLSTYVISKTFPDKVFKYAALKGAGYFESWIVDDLCTQNVLNEKGEIVGSESEQAIKPLLKCYHANGVLATEKRSHKHSHQSEGSDRGELGEDGSLFEFGDDEPALDIEKLMSDQPELESSGKDDTDATSASSKKSSSKKHSSEEKDDNESHEEASLGALHRSFVPNTHSTSGVADELMSGVEREQQIAQSKLLERRHAAIADRVAEKERVASMMKEIHDLHARGVFAGDSRFVMRAAPALTPSVLEPVLEPTKVVVEEQQNSKRHEQAIREVENALQGIL